MNCSNSWKIEIPTSEVSTSWDREESESEITKCSLALRVASPPGSQSELCTTCWTPRCNFLSKSNENSLSHGFNSTCGGGGSMYHVMSVLLFDWPWLELNLTMTFAISFLFDFHSHRYFRLVCLSTWKMSLHPYSSSI